MELCVGHTVGKESQLKFSFCQHLFLLGVF